MSAASNGDGVFWLLAGALGVLGVVTLYFALLHDRSRGRKRCPKCWYDMSASTSLTCSECGNTVKREQKLFKSRRRWRWAVVGGVLVVGSLACALTPTIRRDGWQRLAPNSVLVLCLPESGDAVPPKWRERATTELLNRRLGLTKWESTLDCDQLWDWQWRLILERSITYFETCLRHSSQDQCSSSMYHVLETATQQGIAHEVGLADRVAQFRLDTVRYRLEREFSSGSYIDAPVVITASWSGPLSFAIWPRLTITLDDSNDVINWEPTHLPLHPSPCTSREPKVRVAVRFPEGTKPGMHQLHFTIDEYLADAHGGQNYLPANLKLTTLTRDITIELKGVSTDFVRPDDSPELDALVRSSLRLERLHLGGSCTFKKSRDDQEAKRTLAGIGVVELIRDGEVIGSRQVTLPQMLGRSTFMCNLPSQDELRATGGKGEWWLRFRMDPEAMAAWGVGETYWSGVFDQPIRWNAELQSFVPLDSPGLE